MKSRSNLLLKNIFLFFCGSMFSSSFISQNVLFKGEVTINDSCFVSHDVFIKNLTGLGLINIGGKIDFLVESNQNNSLTIGSQNKNFQIFIKDLPICSLPKKFLSLSSNGQVGVRDAIDFSQMRNIASPADFQSVLVNEINTDNDTLVIQNVNNAKIPIDILIGNPSSDIFLIGANIYINTPIDSHNAEIVFQKPVVVEKDLLIKSLLVNDLTILGSFYPKKDVNFLFGSGVINTINSDQTILLKGKVIFANQLVLTGSLFWEELQAPQAGSFLYLILNENNRVASIDSSFSLDFSKNIAVNNLTVNNLYTDDSKQCLIGSIGDVVFTPNKQVIIDEPLSIDASTIISEGILFFDKLQIIGSSSTFKKLKFANIPQNRFTLTCNTSQFVIDFSIDIVEMNKDNLSTFTNFFLGYAVLEKNSADNSLSLRVLKTAAIPVTAERRLLVREAYEPYIDIELEKISDMMDLSVFGLGLAQVIDMYRELAYIRNEYDALIIEKKQLKQAYIEKKEKLASLKKIIKGIWEDGI